MKYKLTFALVALMTTTAFAAFQAPLPEFKNEKQLAEWRAEKASESTKQGYVAEEAAFYTGKPYLASSGGYAFKYRSYSPELARWTSEDPSGFPDGANGNVYAPTPTSSVDYQGLWKVIMVTSGNLPNDNKTFSWVNVTQEIGTGAVLRSSTAPNVKQTSIQISGQASAQHDFVPSNTYALQVIHQTYTVNVDPSNGDLSIDAIGTAKIKYGNLGIGVLGTKTINGRSLTFEYNVFGAFGGEDLTAVGFNILAVGGNAEWTNSTNSIDGIISITFRAVE